MKTIEEALAPFASYYQWLKAAEAQGEFEEALKDTDVVSALSCCGGSMMLTVGMLREAYEALYDRESAEREGT